MLSANDWPKVGLLIGACPKLGSLKTGAVSLVENGVCGAANSGETLVSSREATSRRAIQWVRFAIVMGVFWRASIGRERRCQRFLMRSNFAAAKFKFG